MRIEVDEDKCVGGGQCVLAAAEGCSISVTGRRCGADRRGTGCGVARGSAGGGDAVPRRRDSGHRVTGRLDRIVVVGHLYIRGERLNALRPVISAHEGPRDAVNPQRQSTRFPMAAAGSVTSRR